LVETVAAASVVGADAPLGRPFGPLAFDSKTTLRASRLALAALVSCDSIGRPMVTQRTATIGNANRTGTNRERERRVARGARIRRGRSMYECRMVPFFGRRRPPSEARRRCSPPIPPTG
jgi:hypothetical protein